MFLKQSTTPLETFNGMDELAIGRQLTSQPVKTQTVLHAQVNYGPWPRSLMQITFGMNCLVPLFENQCNIIEGLFAFCTSNVLILIIIC